MVIPTKVPAQLRAGDTWLWTRAITDYPAPTYALTYRFKNASGGFEITAAAVGTLHSITVDPTVSATFPSGDYDWQEQVDGPLGRFTVESGSFRVQPSLFVGTASAALDVRSHARKALDAINAQIEGRATSDQKEYEIRVNESWRRVIRASLEDLIKAKGYYEGLVASEEAESRSADGLPDKRRSYVRFRCNV